MMLHISSRFSIAKYLLGSNQHNPNGWFSYKCWVRKCSSYFENKFTDSIDTTESQFAKLLVANRGEIACRIIRTAQRMGIRTVAIHSTADVDSLHVRLADESVCVGEASSSTSYLHQERILEAVQLTGAEAVHPGYGFLSESAEFAKELESRGVSFVGPSWQVLAVMGDKLAAKQLALSAGVRSLPGSEGAITSSEQCVEEARRLGYPVMIKARAGGGGIGMRVSNCDQETREGFKLSSQEVATSFSDSSLMLEKYIETPRHIEFQILGDKFGNIIHLNERECSIQRRHQKVIEEAPSSVLSEEQRAVMGRQAVALCRAVGYTSAGTVEFLLNEQTGDFYFLEVNPRLQVEHPVTEIVSSVDLVYQMLRIAKGHPLKLKQTYIKLSGWAVECRIYAENPYKDFLPSSGRLFTYIEPKHLENIRCDSSVDEGAEVSIHYDPLISKLVCHGATRRDAIQTSIAALDSYAIRGVAHNIPILRDIMTESRFTNGNLSTKYLKDVYPEGFKGRCLEEGAKSGLLATACCLYAAEELRCRTVRSGTSQLPPSRALTPPLCHWHLRVALCGAQYSAEVLHSDGVFEVTLENGEVIHICDNINLSSSILPLCIDDMEFVFQIVNKDATGRYKIVCEGTTFAIQVLTELAYQYSKLLPERPKTAVANSLTSPMPGLVKSVACKVGDRVSEGQELCVIEAMKMQNSLCAASDGRIVSVEVRAGETVAKNQLLVVLLE